MRKENPERRALRLACRQAPTNGAVFGVFADWLDEHAEHDLAARIRSISVYLRVDGSGDFAEADRLVWLPYFGVDAIAASAALKTANGRRRERTLHLSDVTNCVVRAWRRRGNPATAEGGTVANAYGYPAWRTLCLAVRSGRRVRVACAVGRANKGASDVTPFGISSARADRAEYQQWARQNGRRRATDEPAVTVTSAAS